MGQNFVNIPLSSAHSQQWHDIALSVLNWFVAFRVVLSANKVVKNIINTKNWCILQIPYIVNFCPETEDDQEASIVVVTEREKFEVPVVCNGMRGKSNMFVLQKVCLF